MARPFCSRLRGAAFCLLLAGATSAFVAPPSSAQDEPTRGVASYYGSYHQGLHTASGERFDMREMTAAHRTLPFGTHVRVTNLANGRAVVVRITDRGPFVRGRLLDVSYAAARRLGLVRSGTAPVEMEII
jgi:peptidoglycan lytic transglycosylase